MTKINRRKKPAKKKKKKRIFSGNGNNDVRWGKISKEEAVHCHR